MDGHCGGRAVSTGLSVSGAPPPGDPPPAAPPHGAPAQHPKSRRGSAARLGPRALIGAVAVWAVAITTLVLVRGGGSATPAARPNAVPSPSASSLTAAQVYQTLLPSVVGIETVGGRSGKPMADSGIGTGVIVNADGTILTAFHVIEGARRITVRYADGTASAAAVGDGDARQDIATLKPSKLPETVVPAVLGGGVVVGDAVVAIGNPLGLTASTTSGVVSGLNRVLPRARAAAIGGLIQFDAAVNPGSSGGPLIDDQGRVAGIVIALVNPTDAGTFIGIGFAVPIGAALGAAQGDGQAPPQ